MVDSRRLSATADWFGVSGVALRLMLLLVLSLAVPIAYPSGMNWCLGAHDANACLARCSDTDGACQVAWLTRDVESDAKMLANAKSTTLDFDGICRLVRHKELCSAYCKERKTKDCALEVLEYEISERVEYAKTARELVRLEERRTKPILTREQLKLHDPRKPIDRNAHPEYTPIGLVQTKAGRGTGWLAGRCLVVTARHVITGDNEEQSPVGQRIKFLVGAPPTDNHNFAYEAIGKVVSAGLKGSEDWALIQLDRPLGEEVGIILTGQYSVDDVKTCIDLEIAGYPGEKPIDKLWWQNNCALDVDISDEYSFWLDCPATPGNSGGPLLCREVNNELVAVGIVYAQTFDVTAQAINFTYNWLESLKYEFEKYLNTCGL